MTKATIGLALRRPLRRALLLATTALVLATAALGWNITNAAAHTFRGTFYYYPNPQAMSGPEPIYGFYGMDANVACQWSGGGFPVENNRNFWPCAWAGTPHEVCISVVNQYWQYELGWDCGWEVVGENLGGAYYGYPVVSAQQQYSGAALFTVTNWP